MQQCTVERKRKLGEVLVAPNTLAEINIPPNLCSTNRGDNFLRRQFLLWESGNDGENCMFIFGTMQNLELLEKYKQWFTDGTFKVAPELFFQVFTLHASINSRATPLLYILMPSKTEEDYTRIFCAIVNLPPALVQRQLSITADYEIASYNAATGIFLNAKIAGCFFHFGQYLW